MAKKRKNYWNYRVVEFSSELGKFYEVCEVHYKDGEPCAYSNATLSGSSNKEMKWALRQFKKAMARKPIKESNFLHIER